MLRSVFASSSKLSYILYLTSHTQRDMEHFHKINITYEAIDGLGPCIMVATLINASTFFKSLVKCKCKISVVALSCFMINDA